MSRDLPHLADNTDALLLPQPRAGDRITLALASDLLRFVVRGAAAPPALDAIGWTLPVTPITATTRDDRSALWLGPDEWLLLDKTGRPAETTNRELATALTGVPASVVDVSCRQHAIAVSGPAAAEALSMFVPLDLDIGHFPATSVARTVFEKAEIVLWRRSTDQFQIEVWRSFAAYVAAMLKEAHAELHATLPR